MTIQNRLDFNPSNGISSAAPVGAVGGSDPTVDSYSWQILSAIGYFDFLIREETTPWAAQQVIQMVNFLDSADPSKTDSYTASILQQFQKGQWSPSWWSNVAGNGQLFNWLKQHPDANRNPTPQTTFQTLFTMFDMETQTSTDASDAEHFFSYYSGGTRIDPHKNYISADVIPILLGFLWQMNGSPNPPISSLPPAPVTPSQSWLNFQAAVNGVSGMLTQASFPPTSEAALLTGQFVVTAQQINRDVFPQGFNGQIYSQNSTWFTDTFDQYLENL